MCCGLCLWLCVLHCNVCTVLTDTSAGHPLFAEEFLWRICMHSADMQVVNAATRLLIVIHSSVHESFKKNIVRLR